MRAAEIQSHKRMQVEFISNNVDVLTHSCLHSVALALAAANTEGRASRNRILIGRKNKPATDHVVG